MARYQHTIWCDGCGVEITWAPYVDNNRLYCCQDCMQGRPCDCAYRLEFEDERRSQRAPPVEDY